jgi:glycosyltransferase involved in cell wall biosynthesis
MVVAVEASRLLHDVRGIGRYVRALLPRLLAQRPGLRLSLFVKHERDIEPVREWAGSLGVGSERVSVQLVREMTRSRADLFWYPWNIARPAPAHGAIVVTIHDLAPLVLPDPRRRKWWPNYRWRRLYRATAKRATIIIADSHFTASEVQRELAVPLERLRVVHLAADDFDVRPVEPDEDVLARLGVRSPFVLAVGAVDRRKNLAFLQQAMPAVAEVFPAARLVLVGPRPADGLEQRDPPWQQTLGFVSEADLAALYRSARALIVPSRHEGFGLPVLEGMRLGAPVICTRVTSLPEVAGDAALYVELGDVAQLTAAIRRVLCDDELVASLRAASLAQSARFSWDETARQTLAAFDDAHGG